MFNLACQKQQNVEDFKKILEQQFASPDFEKNFKTSTRPDFEYGFLRSCRALDLSILISFKLKCYANIDIALLWKGLELAVELDRAESASFLINWVKECANAQTLDSSVFFMGKLCDALIYQQEKMVVFLMGYQWGERSSRGELENWSAIIMKILKDTFFRSNEKKAIVSRLRDSARFGKFLKDNWSDIVCYFFQHGQRNFKDWLPLFIDYGLDINAQNQALGKYPMTLLEFAFQDFCGGPDYFNNRKLIEYLFERSDLDLTQNNQMESLLPLINTHEKAEFLHAQSVKHQANAKKQFSPSLNSIILNDNVYMAKISLRIGSISFDDLNKKVNNTCPKLTEFKVFYQKASDLWGKQYVSLSDTGKIKKLLEHYDGGIRNGFGIGSDRRKDQVRFICNQINNEKLKNPVDIVKALQHIHLSPVGRLTGIVSFLEVKFLSQGVENKAVKDTSVSQQNEYKIGLNIEVPARAQKVCAVYSFKRSELLGDAFIQNGFKL